MTTSTNKELPLDEKLLPCPFCGTDPKHEIDPMERFMVWCPKCDFGVMEVEDWNRRADNAELSALREKVKEYLNEWELDAEARKEKDAQIAKDEALLRVALMALSHEEPKDLFNSKCLKCAAILKIKERVKDNENVKEALALQPAPEEKDRWLESARENVRMNVEQIEHCSKLLGQQETEITRLKESEAALMLALANERMVTANDNAHFSHLEKQLQMNKEIADNQTWHVRRLEKQLHSEREAAKGLVEAAELVGYNIAGQEGTLTNSNLPHWFRARLDGLKEALALYQKSTSQRDGEEKGKS